MHVSAVVARNRPLTLALVLILSAPLSRGGAVAEEQLSAASASWPQIGLSEYATGVERPVHVTHAGDDSGRLFAVEQPGRIRVFKEGELLATPFLDISARVACCGERGLFSVAFPPDYSQTGRFYVDYTNKDWDTVIARFRLSDSPDIADPESEEILLEAEQPKGNHNGGQIAFGPNDGFLYIGLGDGGGSGDPWNHGQNPASLLGKILRIDVESGAVPYAIPGTNPFTRTATTRDEIWALGV